MKHPLAVNDDAAGVGRIPVLDLRPRTPDARWNPKAYVGEVVPFSATVFREGHDPVGAMLELTAPDGSVSRHRMHEAAPGTDRWVAEVQLTQTGRYRWSVLGFSDDWASWVHVAEIKLPAGLDLAVTAALGAQLLERAIAHFTALGNSGTSSAPLGELNALLTLLRKPKLSVAALLKAIHSAELTAAFSADPVFELSSRSEEHTLLVERARAGVGAWYELFPRSEGATQRADSTWQSGTFATAKARLPEVAAMGFDVVYLPPIHPIGLSHRKGRNNTLDAAPGDPGSPWAIGGAAGGHDAIHPDLGSMAQFRAFLAAASKVGLEVAIDLALQASPDHPWVREHPEWFTTLPDGSIATAENPPKKYQDIYPLNFDNDPAGISAEVLRIVEFWIDAGVKIFRVDNPHTKPLQFWEWLIRTVNATHPDVVFLAEAFTRPAPMLGLAMVGFQQSYSYFTWRNTKTELEEFLQSISHDTSDFYRPNLWVNTPDILTEYLQFGGPAAFSIRATIAATAAPLWGVYSGFELFEAVARPGAEEAIDNEKYEYKPRDFAGARERGESLELYLGILNQIRREHPALGQLRNLTLQRSDDDAVLVYSKHLDGAFTPDGTPDTIIVVVNTDPHSVRETSVHLELSSLGLPDGAQFSVRDLVTGDRWDWSASGNYVRLDAFERPAHVLLVERPSPTPSTRQRTRPQTQRRAAPSKDIR